MVVRVMAMAVMLILGVLRVLAVLAPDIMVAVMLREVGVSRCVPIPRTVAHGSTLNGNHLCHRPRQQRHRHRHC